MFRTRRSSSRIDRQRCTFCSTPQLLAATRLHDPTRLCRPLQAPDSVQNTLNQADVFDLTPIKDLEDFMMTTLPGEEALKNTSAR